MLPKKNRLSAAFFRNRRQIVFSFVCGNISVRVFKSEKNIFRCAVIVPTKTKKTAVARNKIRRMIYHILQINLSQLPIYDTVWFISGSENIERDIYTVIQKLLQINKTQL